MLHRHRHRHQQHHHFHQPLNVRMNSGCATATRPEDNAAAEEEPLQYYMPTTPRGLGSGGRVRTKKEATQERRSVFWAA